jgi:hypothetical protein
MPAKKKGPSMRENQQRKLTMQKIAKGGKQLSGVKKPAAAGPTQKADQLSLAKLAKGQKAVIKAFSKDKAAKDRARLPLPAMVSLRTALLVKCAPR